MSYRSVLLVGAEGIEPSMPDPKTGALPLGYAPGAGEEGIEPPSLGLKPRILADELFPRYYFVNLDEKNERAGI